MSCQPLIVSDLIDFLSSLPPGTPVRVRDRDGDLVSARYMFEVFEFDGQCCEVAR